MKDASTIDYAAKIAATEQELADFDALIATQGPQLATQGARAALRRRLDWYRGRQAAQQRRVVTALGATVVDAVSTQDKF